MGARYVDSPFLENSAHGLNSGAGKTTCLDVLAQRKNIGVISGDILVDGRPLAADFARGTAYGVSDLCHIFYKLTES